MKRAESVIVVVAAIVIREGRLLLARRPAGVHLEHHWELPGGKVEPGESPRAALAREVREELGVGSRVGDPFAFSDHAYPDRTILLLTYLTELDGEPSPLACAELGWFPFDALSSLPTPPADAPVFERLRASPAPEG
ncbi:MAG TPA: (deoxy)nucleoside triphosphate pyrophosphohydrolase [Candidatus Polarisedimenticolia bacterium]|nr:(deoxy)nucleoside triphosphate pyrophosphohydrolase [Candidatus Polarisedimenticolia bacterium]